MTIELTIGMHEVYWAVAGISTYIVIRGQLKLLRMAFTKPEPVQNTRHQHQHQHQQKKD